MGNCKHCNLSFKLQDGEEVICPNCGLYPYSCWNCNNEIKGKLHNCSVCGFYVCPSCGECGKDCKIPTLIRETNNMLSKRKIIEYIYGSFQGHQQLVCDRYVPITQGKTRIKEMILRADGYKIKNEEDRKRFNERLDKIYEYPLGKTWTVTQAKDDGTFGNEERTASYASICMGKAKIIKVVLKRNKKGEATKSYLAFKRIDIDTCEYINTKKLMVKKCSMCDDTIDIKDGGDKCFEHDKKYKIMNGLDSCNLNRNLFNVKKRKK